VRCQSVRSMEGATRRISTAADCARSPTSITCPSCESLCRG
jgi:hypothetical protein